ncbi:hypothetical protein FOPG_19182 [Fusarium oxysporum f. sp. conglutinans race 2 54008]|uniref:Uncharacterized protein n=1 Tax=Fusarium oxysporum f. sp. conglutinans race 2 54008 TaxID=1089457 RepID=X0GLQ8_FUSOX|nr:hypothetical protein FOPG_19182 [Fusarium oxysporum f. sp. conglutinans race 2 54008]
MMRGQRIGLLTSGLFKNQLLRICFSGASAEAV